MRQGTGFNGPTPLTFSYTHPAKSTVTKLSRRDMTEAKRLEELRLNDTIYHDCYDMHFYDGDGPLYDYIVFLFIIIITSYIGCVHASSVLLGLCPDHSRHSLASRIPDVCIATVSKRLSGVFSFMDDLGCPSFTQIAIFLASMVARKKKSHED
jgi:hypothetical protein